MIGQQLEPDSLIARNLAEVRERVELAARFSGRSASEITIVAVSKTFPREAVDEAHALGLNVFGENRLQEATAKFADSMPTEMRVHLIGQLQSNKVRPAIALFDRIESVDRISLITALEKEAARIDTRVSVLLQVNVSREVQKSGCGPYEAILLAEAIVACDHLRLDGLMGIAPFVDDAVDARPAFRELRALRDSIVWGVPGSDLPVLSMGMSGDFEVAIEEGATHVRIGSAIFGGR